MKKIVTKNRIFLFLTLCCTVCSGVLNAVPDHRFGYGDYSLFAALTVFPVLYLIHGILCGTLMSAGWVKKAYLPLTLGLSCLSFLLSDLIRESSAWLPVQILPGLANGLLYMLCSQIGMLLYRAIMAIGKTLWSVRNGYKPR